MRNSQVLFDYSPWFILLCITAGLLYAGILYVGKNRFERSTRLWLAGLRFVLVAGLCFLLLAPIFKQIKNEIERPTYVVVVDNSMSLALVKDSTVLRREMLAIQSLREQLEDEDFNIDIIDLEGRRIKTPISELPFDGQTSNLNLPLTTIQTMYEGRNLAGVILYSDGIYNQGISPAYATYNFKIHTLGAGDTLPKKDISLRALYYNKITYQGNQFPLVAELQHDGFEGESVTLKVIRKGKLVKSLEVKFTKTNQVLQAEFLLEADEKGIQHYVVEVEEKSGEFTNANNVAHAYIDVVEGREKILILANSPHPDIKAIKSALEKNDNYEVAVKIVSLLEPKELQSTTDEKYDLLVLHQLPSYQAGSKAAVDVFLKKATPTWYILGGQSNINAFNEGNTLLNITVMKGTTDKVRSTFAPGFSGFTFPAAYRQIMQSYPPVTVPFGKYQLKTEGQTLLTQRVGNVETENPLLVISNTQGSKTAVLAGDGIWLWRLAEFAETGGHAAFDNLILKITQYLSSKDDKRKFRVYPIQNEVVDNEPVIFETEVYNDIYESIYNQNVDLEVVAEDGKVRNYNYITSEANTQFKVNELPAGIYTYKASTVIAGKSETTNGQFSVTSFELESMQLTADHSLLRTLANQTDGSFHTTSKINELADILIGNPAQGTIYSQETFLPIINLWWIFLILILLISAEWFIRKYNGAY